MKGQIKVGTYTGDGAIQNILLGFEPDFVMLFNITDGDLAGIWFRGMTADTGIDIAAAVAANAADAITAYAGSEGANAKGFTVGTDYSESAKVYRYVALANQ
jgi:hypothetical protein